MIPLYTVWGGTSEICKNPNTIGVWVQIWEGNDKVELPLPWAKAYAQELSIKCNLPVEVRNRHHKIRAVYGMDTAE